MSNIAQSSREELGVGGGSEREHWEDKGTLRGNWEDMAALLQLFDSIDS